MAILLNDSIKVQGGKPVEDKRLNNGTAWESVEQVNQHILPTDRYVSLEVLIGDKIYWYKGGVADDNLVEKQEGSSIALPITIDDVENLRTELHWRAERIHFHSWNDIIDKPTIPQLDNIKIGGRNLIRNSQIEIYRHYFRPNLTTPLINREVYSFSFEAKGNLEGRVFFNYNTDAYYSAENTTEWKRFSVTFTFVSNDYQGVQVFPHIYGATNIRNVKLEKGNKPTDWSPAPEDIFDEIRKTLLKTTDNITTSQYLEGYSQNGRTVISQGTANIVVTVDSEDGFVSSYQKGGTGNITFQAGAGKNLIQVDGINTINGARGSTATITILGNDILLRISNV